MFQRISEYKHADLILPKNSQWGSDRISGKAILFELFFLTQSNSQPNWMNALDHDHLERSNAQLIFHDHTGTYGVSG